MARWKSVLLQKRELDSQVSEAADALKMGRSELLTVEVGLMGLSLVSLPVLD